MSKIAALPSYRCLRCNSSSSPSVVPRGRTAAGAARPGRLRPRAVVVGQRHAVFRPNHDRLSYPLRLSLLARSSRRTPAGRSARLLQHTSLVLQTGCRPSRSSEPHALLSAASDSSNATMDPSSIQTDFSSLTDEVQAEAGPSTARPSVPVKAPLKRGSACRRCRLRKNRCTGERPVCGLCQKVSPSVLAVAGRQRFT